MRGWMYLGTFEGVHMYRQNRQYMGVVIETSTPTPTAEGVYAPDPVYASFDVIPHYGDRSIPVVPNTVFADFIPGGTKQILIYTPDTVTVTFSGKPDLSKRPFIYTPDTVVAHMEDIPKAPVTESGVYPIADSDYKVVVSE